MSLFKMRWLRNVIRSTTKPIPMSRAAKAKQRLSIIYAIVAWNAFGFVCYAIYQGKSDWAAFHGLSSEDERKLSPAQRWVHLLGMKNAEIFRVTGLTVTKLDNPLQETNVADNETMSNKRAEENRIEAKA